MGPADVATALIAEITGNSYILLGVMVAMVFGIAYGLYTRQGSGISKHPTPDSQDPVLGDETKSKGEDEHEDERAGVDQTEGSPMRQRGTE